MAAGEMNTQTAAQITDSIHIAMRNRYSAPEWALLFGVGNATGWGCAGWGDAIAMNLYPSRGLAIHGFEFKSHRGDWKKELANPDKAENIARYCDYWWLVAEDGILRDGELPKGWGYLEHRNGNLRIVAAASQMEPAAVNRHFLAAILRRSQGEIEGVVDKLVKERVEEKQEQREARLEQQVKERTREFTKLEEKVKEIKERCGIDLLDYTPSDEIAAAIKFCLSADALAEYNGIGGLLKEAEGFAKRIRKTAQEMGVEFPT